MTITIQQAAYQILKERQGPLDSKTVAKIAIDSGLVTSSARDPIASMAQTIEKNIRDGVNNRPELTFIHEGRHRLIGLLGTSAEVKPAVSQPQFSGTVPQQLSARIPSEVMEKIRLAELAKIGANFDDTVAALILAGFRVEAPRIKEAIDPKFG